MFVCVYSAAVHHILKVEKWCEGVRHKESVSDKVFWLYRWTALTNSFTWALFLVRLFGVPASSCVKSVLLLFTLFYFPCLRSLCIIFCITSCVSLPILFTWVPWGFHSLLVNPRVFIVPVSSSSFSRHCRKVVCFAFSWLPEVPSVYGLCSLWRDFVLFCLRTK